MANIDSHPWTYAIQFAGVDVPELISIEGFRTLLENTYEIRLGKAKRPSYIRNRAWLTAIANQDERPPVGYPTNVASWKHEIGYTKPETAKWICHNGQVFNKKGKNTATPHTASEDLYVLMTNVHHFHGHMGRDNFYKVVQKLSATPTKDFCNSFINSCCSKASMWVDGGLVNPHQLPVAVAKPAAAAATAHVRPLMDAPAGNPLRNDNGVSLGNGAPFDNAVALEGMGLVYNPAPANMWHHANIVGEFDDSMNAMIGEGMGIDFAGPATNWQPAAPAQVGQQIAYFPEMQYTPLPTAAPVQSLADHSDLDQFFAPNPAPDQPIRRGRSPIKAVEQPPLEPSLEPSPERGQDAQTGLVVDYDEYLDQAMSENLPFDQAQGQDAVMVDTPAVDQSQGWENMAFVQNQDPDQVMAEDLPVDNSQVPDQAMVDDLPVADNRGPHVAVEANQPESLPVESTEVADFDMSDFVDFDGETGGEVGGEFGGEVDVNVGGESGGNFGMEAVEEAGMEDVGKIGEDFPMEFSMEIDVNLGGYLDLDPNINFGVEDIDWDAVHRWSLVDEEGREITL